MNCRKVSRWLSAYIEGDLQPLQKRRMDEHLQNCAACREKLSDISMITQMSGELEKLEPGPFFANRVLCEVAAQKQKRWLLQGWRLKLALSAASFVVAAIVTFMNMSPSLMSPTMIADKQSGNGNAASADFVPISGKLARAGFPVSDDILKRDMALVESLKSDSQALDSLVLPKGYIQQVDQSH
ncbi:MAG: hypothetical protein GX409_00365 [candidate division Zixibacteria bacterium]|nr:hypothetical protein [candidate division Zixibacteria bacterium]